MYVVDLALLWAVALHRDFSQEENPSLNSDVIRAFSAQKVQWLAETLSPIIHVAFLFLEIKTILLLKEIKRLSC